MKQCPKCGNFRPLDAGFCACGYKWAIAPSPIITDLRWGKIAFVVASLTALFVFGWWFTEQKKKADFARAMRESAYDQNANEAYIDTQKRFLGGIGTKWTKGPELHLEKDENGVRTYRMTGHTEGGTWKFINGTTYTTSIELEADCTIVVANPSEPAQVSCRPNSG